MLVIIFLRIFWEFFWRIFFGGIFWEKILGGFFLRNSTKSYLNMEGIDLFVKILSKSRRKEGGQNLDP